MNYWFLKCDHDQADQTPRFHEHGIWETAPQNKASDLIKSIQVDDKVAGKIYSLRRGDLPFDNSKGLLCSVMKITATGTVLENPGDGRSLKIKWDNVFDTLREWFFFTSSYVAWKVVPDNEKKVQLIDFAFQKKIAEHRLVSQQRILEREARDSPRRRTKIQVGELLRRVC